jgi:hypothetical protein
MSYLGKAGSNLSLNAGTQYAGLCHRSGPLVGLLR